MSDTQFMQDEVLSDQNRGRRVHSIYKTNKKPMYYGVYGTVYRSDIPVHTFRTSQNSFPGEANSIEIINCPDIQPIISVKSISINYETGELDLHWTKAPGKNSVKISYEYDYTPKSEVKQDLPVLDETGGMPESFRKILQEIKKEKADEVKLTYLNQSEFVSNEVIKTSSIFGLFKQNSYNYFVEHNPILKGSITGTVYFGAEAVQTFVVTEAGKFSFTDIGNPEIKVKKGTVDYKAGMLSLTWNSRKAENNHIVLSYEYEFHDPKEDEIQKVTDRLKREIKQNKGFIKPTFEKFFSNEEILAISANSGTICCWDFHTALGDTLKEKYESLYIKLVELTNVLIHKGAKGYFWLVTSPEVASVFEIANGDYHSAYCTEDYLDGQCPMGLDGIKYCGLIKSKWRLYKSFNLSNSNMLIGCNDKIEDFTHYARLNIVNFFL